MSTTKAASIVICALGLFTVTQVQAETIDFTIATPTQSITAPVLISTPNFAIVNTILLNADLAAAGIGYEFSGLFGTSNFPGSGPVGTLDLNGGVRISSTTASSGPLFITETESGFTTPSGLPGRRTFSGTTNLVAIDVPATHSSNGSLNSTRTGAFSFNLVSPGTTGFGSGGSQGDVPTFFSPYTLDNEISLTLTGSGSSDDFTASIVVTAVPLPSSLPLLLGGLGLLCWVRVARGAVRNVVGICAAHLQQLEMI